MKYSSINLSQAIKLALAACATTASPFVHAQASSESGANEPAMQEVVVTGSRIAVAPNDISLSPITSVSQVDIQKTGLIRVEDVLNNLPSVTADQNSGESISSVGVATVSLRDLGAQRTLVLVDGKRLQPGGAGGVPPGTSSAADVNQIPAALIESVDVLTGGASSVYGADAVAGVVNFIMNTHFEGVKIDSDYSFYDHSNDSAQYLGYLNDFGATKPESTAHTGQSKDFSIVAGSNFADGKGNATTYFTYTKTNPVAGYQLDHSGCTLIGGSSNSAADSKPRCGGSGTNATGNFFALGTVGANTTTLFQNTVDSKTGVFRPLTGADLYNYGALSYFQRSSERYTTGAFLHYDINDNVTVYTESMFARNKTQAQYGPSGDFTTPSVISCANPLLTPSELAVICSPANLAANQKLYGTVGSNAATVYIGRRNVEGGGRQDNYTSDSFRQVIGARGAFMDAWSYDVSAQVGISQLQDIEANFLGTPQIAAALDVVTDPATGQPACASALTGVNPTCVPWNIFQKGGVTSAALAYLTTPATYSSTSTEYVVTGSVTGDLGKYGMKVPTAEKGLQVNLGSEYREEKFVFQPDYVFLNGYQAGGAPSKAVDGGLHVWEGFTEFKLPLIDKLPGIYNLSLDAGYRFSSYTLGGNTNTYKFQVEYAPIESLRFRGGYNRAVRAPNLGELFQPAAVGSGGSPDPCWGTAPTLTQAQCANTGVTAAEYGHITVNPAAQTNSIQGGNTGLTPEIADTYTFGIVFKPEFVSGLTMSLDAYNIKIRNVIAELSTATIINTCALTGAGCDLIHRGPTGSLWFSTNNYVVATQQNLGSELTRGADLSVNYLLDMNSLGKLSTNLMATYTKDFETEPLKHAGQYDCAGYAGNTCGPPLPHTRSVLTSTWLTPWYGLDFTARWRFIGSTKTEFENQSTYLSSSYYTNQEHIPGYNYIDLSASSQVNQYVNVRLGVNNVADKNPPLVLGGALGCVSNNCNDNTWAGTYDALGRYLYAHVTVKF